MTALSVPLKLNGVIIGTAEVDPDAGTVTGHITHPDAARRLFHQALEQLSLSLGPADASLVVNRHHLMPLLALPENLEQYRREREGRWADANPMRRDFETIVTSEGQTVRRYEVRPGEWEDITLPDPMAGGEEGQP